MNTSLAPESTRDILLRLDAADASAARTPITAPANGAARRQPVHAVYGGAQLFKNDTPTRLRRLARRALDDYAPDAATLARALGLAGAGLGPKGLASIIYERVRNKIERDDAVEDFRIDFEDGYGIRPNEEEDRDAELAASEAAKGAAAGTLPGFLGIRIKPLSAALRDRSIRTLDIFLSTLVPAMSGKPPQNFVVTLPKITTPEQVAALAGLLDALESKLGLAAGALRLEVMIETPQALLAKDGSCNLPRLIDAAGGRCAAAHFGPYDFLGSLGVTAADQSMGHPACDFARHLMLTAFAGSGVTISDSCTTTLPVPPHVAAAGKQLTAVQQVENRAAVHKAWKQHYDDIRHSLSLGFYQGWDVHPAQLPTRYAAVYAYFLEALDVSSERMRNFLEKAAQATRVGGYFDDAATGEGLLNFFQRAVNSGALGEAEAVERSGLTTAELRSGSLLAIMKRRSK